MAGADAVLHGLDPALGIAAAICRQRPGLPVVAEQRRRADGSLEPVSEGCTPLTFPCSVRGQIDAGLLDMRRSGTIGDQERVAVLFTGVRR